MHLAGERIPDEAVRGMLGGVGFTPGQPRTAVTTTPAPLASWAHDTLRPLPD
ncbi:hypothetical protein TOK_3582 [Pseudonocardia sp. N23]|nr:hypothetical protein TOK_3582 [Pseudonocardia sp. N23]